MIAPRRPDRRAAGAREAPGPESVKDILDRVVRDLRLPERRREGAVASAWARASGPELTAQTRAVAYRSGVLTVEVDGASLLQEVRGFRAADLLRALRAERGGEKVREIRFVPGGRAGA